MTNPGADSSKGEPPVEDDESFLDEVFEQTLERLEQGISPEPDELLGGREDLRSRLAWGLVYEVKPLTDAERATYLRAEAARRGLRLADDVVTYLLIHVRRDMGSLGAILDHLDRTSLEQQRAVTLPLVREALRGTP